MTPTYHKRNATRAPGAMYRRITGFLQDAYGARRTIHVAHDERNHRIHAQLGGWSCGAPFSVWIPLTAQGWKSVHKLCEKARLAADEASKLHAQPTT